MSFDIGSRSDATEQARLVDSGEASATELVSAAIEAAEQLNPQLNAIIHERYERALAEAAAIDREGTDGRALAGLRAELARLGVDRRLDLAGPAPTPGSGRRRTASPRSSRRSDSR